MIRISHFKTVLALNVPGISKFALKQLVVELFTWLNINVFLIKFIGNEIIELQFTVLELFCNFYQIAQNIK